MNAFNNREVAAVFEAYPDIVRQKLMFLRQLIFDTAKEIVEFDVLEETLKWGEPSYLTKPKTGSTIRIDWKQKTPDQYAMYFHCKTTLVDTFKEIYGEKFSYEGNRAIIFNINDDIPIEELKHCIALSLSYHQRKTD